MMIARAVEKNPPASPVAGALQRPPTDAMIKALEDADFTIQPGRVVVNDMVTLCEQGKIILANGIVYGVNHAAAGKAIYSNFVVYGEEKDNGVASVNSRQYAGSAAQYLPPGTADMDKLYVWMISRQPPVGYPNCLKLLPPPPGQKYHGIPVGSNMYLGVRAYVEPETKVGPAWQELVFDRAILFTRKGA